MKNSFLVILILFSAMAFGQDDSAETPKIGIKIPLGKTVQIKDVSIKFLEVMEDSRCPKNVNCIWAGRAVVKMEVTADGKKQETTLTFGDVKPGEKKNTTIFNSTEFAINGLKLNPYPDSDNKVKDKGYVLLVCEEKNN
jgi:hypothetical protein